MSKSLPRIIHFNFKFMQIEENEVLEPSSLISTVDKQRIQVLTRSTPTPNLQGTVVFDNECPQIRH